jgi:Holliday junction resolvase
MTMNSRAKGARGERELADHLRQYGLTARRAQQYCGAAGDSDLIVEELPRLLVECKRVERLHLEKAFSKAITDAAAANKIPVLCHRKNGGEWLITMRLDELGAVASLWLRATGKDRAFAEYPG